VPLGEDALSSYEETIKYHDEETWRKYFEEEMGELYAAVRGFIKFREELVEKLGSAGSVKDIISESDEYKKMLFGGVVVKDGPYAERAMAKFYAEVIGIKVKDLDGIMGQLRSGVSLDKATEESWVEFVDTKFAKLVNEIYERLESIYDDLKDIVKPPEPKKYDSTRADSGLKAVEDILNAALKLLPHYNLRSSFI